MIARMIFAVLALATVMLIQPHSANAARYWPPHADQRHPLCRNSGSSKIHQHLAPLPRCGDWDDGQLMSTIRGRISADLDRVLTLTRYVPA
jgi:hypothetical protein